MGKTIYEKSAYVFTAKTSIFTPQGKRSSLKKGKAIPVTGLGSP
jgi:hypothetical protein